MSAPKPVDFDALLDALGASDAEPPPLMKKLLADIRPALVERSSENARADHRPSTAVGGPFLRSGAFGNRSDIPLDRSAVDAAVIAELEAWLAALRAERRSPAI